MVPYPGPYLPSARAEPPKLPLDIASQRSGLLNGLLTDDGLNVEFRLVVYDVEKVAQAILDSELSDEFAGQLRDARGYLPVAV